MRNKENQKKLWREHYKRNTDKYIAKKNARKAEIRQYIKDSKLGKPCTDCGVLYSHYVMDYDHLSNKEYDIGKMSSHGFSIKRVQEEIDKCELVCSNCHRERTFSRIER